MCGSTLKVLALERVEKFETNRLKMKLTSSWRDETLVMSLRICETKDENPAVIGDKVRMRTKNELLEVVVVVVVEQGLDIVTRSVLKEYYIARSTKYKVRRPKPDT